MGRADADTNLLERISDLAERLGVTHRTLRFYEERRLLSSVIVGNVRYYDEHQTRRATSITKFRSLGFTLAEIRRLLPVSDGDANSAKLKVAIARQITELERRRSEVEAALDELRLIAK